MPGLIKTLSECDIALKTLINVPQLLARGYSKKNTNASLLISIKAGHEDSTRHRFDLFYLRGHILNGDLGRTALFIDHGRINDDAGKKAGRFAVQLV